MNKFVLSAVSAMVLLSTSTFALAGVVNGPRFAEDVVGPNANMQYWETAYSNENTYVTLSASCNYDQDIDLWVYDENNNLVAKSTTDGCFESVSFNPKWTGPFRIVVENINKPYSTAYRLDIE